MHIKVQLMNLLKKIKTNKKPHEFQNKIQNEQNHIYVYIGIFKIFITK